MNKVLITTVSVGLMVSSVMAGATFSTDFANAHIFRGATASDSFVVQPSVEATGFGMPEEYGSFILGAWGSMAPFDDVQDTMYETDWYLAYALPEFVEKLDLSVGLTEYAYSAGLNERELNLGAGYEVAGFALGASINFMIDDRNLLTEKQTYLDFSADYGFDISEQLSASAGALVGYMIQGDGNSVFLDDGLNQIELYGAADYALGEVWSLNASLAYIGQLNDKVLTDAAHDVSILALFGVSCEL